jgi:hypothetical protein
VADPVSILAKLAMRGYAAAAAQARPDSHFAAARARLGPERHTTVACEALRAELLELLAPEGKEGALAALQAGGEHAARRLLTGVVAGAISRVTAAGAPCAPPTPEAR